MSDRRITSTSPHVPSVFLQRMFQKYELSEIAIGDLDESKLGNTVIDLENTFKGELSSIILTYLSNYIDHDFYDEDLFWELKQDFVGVLMEKGTFVPLKGYFDAISLEMAIPGSEPHIWTKEEIAADLKRKLNYHPKISIQENK
ncbi:hypothetical protein GcM3_200050 [Golovinomyces cichoracearum]|uniref:Uncharacterized protein n=1 Tax=Golovinomyces cichoracearum TaxID=62708 RepID=A0A420HDZ8_9PEZI|nr:hypothetical protein GcM3_200050 [Golovinomyces cichoracearum]